MNIFENFEPRDIVNIPIVINDIVDMNISNAASLTCIDSVINTQIATQSTQLFNINVADSTSGYYNTVKWSFYQKSGADNIELLSGTSSTASTTAANIKLITVPRETLKDRIVPYSLSSTILILTLLDSTSGTKYIQDDPIISTSGTSLFSGKLKINNGANFVTSSSLTSVGEVFYNYGVIVFRGSDVGVKSLSSFVSSTSATFVNGSGTGNGRINIETLTFSREQQKNNVNFFCRAYNDAFNYSNNPTYRNPDASIIDPVLAVGNVTYVSQVGIYDDNNNLLAVANINPVKKKTFEDELGFKISIVY